MTEQDGPQVLQYASPTGRAQSMRALVLCGVIQSALWATLVLDEVRPEVLRAPLRAFGLSMPNASWMFVLFIGIECYCVRMLGRVNVSWNHAPLSLRLTRAMLYVFASLTLGALLIGLLTALWYASAK